MNRQSLAYISALSLATLLASSLAMAQAGAAAPSTPSNDAPAAPTRAVGWMPTADATAGGVTTTAEPAPASTAPPSTGATAASSTSSAAPNTGERCRLGAHVGIDENDAVTASSLVCRELPVNSSNPETTYRVDFDKLGTVIFVTLTSESHGNTVDARRAKLDRIEDIAVAAPHLVTALAQSKTLKETEKVGNLTASDTTAPLRKYGQFQFSGGVLAAFAPGASSLSPGVQAALRYDTPTWVLSTQLRLGWDTGGGQGMDFYQLGVGPAYMLSLDDTSLFVGGGMAILGITNHKDVPSINGASYNQSVNNSGVGAYAEVGVEMMRLHRNRLNASLRADLPAFTVGGDYLVPLSLTTSFVFD